jgi:signal transduction histidine kinase
MIDGRSQLKGRGRRLLAARYVAALGAELGGHRPGRDGHAKELGQAALDGGLATLDVAVMHGQAVSTLASSHNFADLRNGSLKRAGNFLIQALTPLELAQRDTRETNWQLRGRNETLRRLTVELTKGSRTLKREVARRMAGELAVRKSREQYRMLFLESQVMQKKLRQMTRQIIMAQEEERKEISRELHDDVVQTLVGINVELSALGKGASVGLRALKKKIARTQRLVENSVNAVHRFARELRPAVLDDLGLIPALTAYSKSLAERKKLRIQMTAFGGVEALGNVKRTVLFRVAQEALTNIARHAQATEVTMSISEISGAIRMEISDNGRSFNVKKALFSNNPKRLGLVGMKERVEMVGGKLTIESLPGKGTTVRAEIPFKLEKERK